MALSPDEISQYTPIIDSILKQSDLRTVSAKKIRRQLQDELSYDISSQKDFVNDLIGQRFDLVGQMASTEGSDAPQTESPTNGHSNGTAKKEVRKDTKAEPSVTSPSPVTMSEIDSEAEINPPKKKQRKTYADSDAKLAAMLQAEENSRNRQTRGAQNKKPVTIRKKSTPKKKSAAKVKADDDSDMETGTDGERRSVVRKGGFHKEYLLSEPLAELVGAPQLSRPQVVKKIWAYIKERNLQDPNDKRQILCEEKLYSVFKSDKVHMFTMNKILGKHLYPVEETAP